MRTDPNDVQEARRQSASSSPGGAANGVAPGVVAAAGGVVANAVARGIVAGALGAVMVAAAQAGLGGAGGALPGRAWLMGAFLAAAAAGAALGAAGGAALGLLGALPARIAAGIAGAGAALVTGALGAALTAGPRAAASALRWPAVTIAALVAGATAALLAAKRDRAQALLARRPLVAVALCAPAGFAMAVADRVLLPGLYSLFHVALRLGAVGLLAGAVLVAWAGLGARAHAPEAAERPEAPEPIGLRARATLLAAGAALALGLVGRGALESGPGAAGGSLSAWSPAVWSILERVAPPPPPPPRMLPAPPAPAVPEVRLDLLGADVFVLTIDALRSDHVGFAGSTRGLTPHLDRFAAGGAVALRTYSPGPNSSYALSSMFTAHYQFSRRRAFPDARRDLTLADWMSGLGYRTLSFANEGIWHIDAERLQAYRDSALGFTEVVMDYSSAEQRAVQILEAVRAAKGRLFLWAHLHDVHEPYDARPGYGPAVAGATAHLSAAERYASEVAYTDAHVGPLLETLARLRPGAIFILTADHGESFGEHGLYFHGTSLYEEELRVPLVVRAPGIPAGRRSGAVASLSDLWPTLAAALGVSPPPTLNGRSLLGELVTGAPRGTGRVVVSEIETGRAAIGDEGKMVCATVGAARTPGRCVVYDLAADPGETRDATATRPALAASLMAGLAEADRESLERGAAGADGDGARPDPAHLALARGAVGDVEVAPALRALLTARATDTGLRERAAALLEKLDDKTAVPALLEIARDASEPIELRRAAAAAAGLMSAPAARPVLLLLGPPPPPYDPARHWLALGALGEHDGAWEGLAETIKHPVPEIRDRTLLALRDLRDPRTAPALVAALDAWQTRPGAAEALGAIGDRENLGPLVASLGAEMQIQNRGIILAAIARLGGDLAISTLLVHLAAPEDTIGVMAGLDARGIPGPRGGPRGSGSPAAPRAITGDGWRCDPVTHACAALAETTRVRPVILTTPPGPSRIPGCPSATLVLDARAPAGVAGATLEARVGGLLAGTVLLGNAFREHHLVFSRSMPAVAAMGAGPAGAFLSGAETPLVAPEIELRWIGAKSPSELGFLRYAAVLCAAR